MAVRGDGKETKNRLLESACQVFSEKGYHDATVAEICRRAGANVASVNYHFGDKAHLYIEVWKYAFSQYPGPEEPDPSKPPQERLRDYIHSIVRFFMDQGPHGRFVRLYLMELLNPTGLVQDLWHQLVKPKRCILLGIIRELMGKEEMDKEVVFCELSVVALCRILITVRRWDLEYILGEPLSQDLMARWADHITWFSLAGILAVSEGNVSPEC